MQEQLQKRFAVIKDKWANLTRDQKLKLIIATVVLLTSLAAFIFISLRPNMVPLMRDLPYEDLGEVQKVLDENTVPYVTQDTDILVDEKNVSKAKVVLATANVPTSKTGYTYTEAFANSGMTATDSVKKESFRLAAQTEIADNLSTLDGVDSAKVTINVPENNNYFIKDQAPTTASVVLTTSRDITKSEGLIMARLVAMSVEGLSLDNIEISDQNVASIYSGAEQTSNMASASDAYEQELVRRSNIEESVKKTLSPLYSDVFVNPNIVMNWNEETPVSTQYQSPDDTATNTGYVDTTTTDKSTYENTTPADVPGTATNGQATTYDSANGDNSSASTNKGQTNYIYNKTDTQTKKQVGVVDDEKSSIAITVYNNKIYDEKTLQDQGTLEGTSWEEYKATIPASTPLTIDESLIANIQAGTGISQVSIIGYEVPTFIDAQVVPIDIRQIIMFVVLALLILMLAVGLIRNTKEEEITEIEPELSVEDLLLSTQLEEEKEIQRLREIEYNAENETKRQIDKFVKEKPDAVAQLLRNWLSEDWE